MTEATLQPINHVVMMCPLLFFLLFFLFLFRSYHNVFSLTHTVSSEVRPITMCTIQATCISNYALEGAMCVICMRIENIPCKANYSMNQPNAGNCITA